MKASKMATAKHLSCITAYRNNMSNVALAFIEMEHILNEWGL